MKAPFKMKGHTLPGINQRSEGNTDLPDGRSGSSPFQHRSGKKHKNPHVTTTYSKKEGKLSMTKTKGDKSSTWTQTKSTKIKGGRTVELTNEKGNVQKRILKGVKKSPAKWAQFIPMIMSAAGSMGGKKKE